MLAVDLAVGPSTVRFVASGHASLEELYILKALGTATGGVTIGWREREKPQPRQTKFRIPAIDAPNVRGARDLGFDVVDANAPKGPAAGPPEGPAFRSGLPALRQAVEAGHVRLLYVFDPGPDGTLGDVDWILAARKSGTIQTLVVQGVLRTPLADAADIVLPGLAFVEKDATYTNMTGHVQATSRAIPPPGDAAEDWQILEKVGLAVGAQIDFPSGTAVRAAIAEQLASVPGYATLADVTFSRPVSARHWLQTSNPSERWKWNFMFQDLPPVKFGEDFGPIPRADVIPPEPVE
jgi:NADH-quinone oxidoreductase subunit G